MALVERFQTAYRERDESTGTLPQAAISLNGVAPHLPSQELQKPSRLRSGPAPLTFSSCILTLSKSS